MGKVIQEPAKTIPVLADADVVVAGGGLSGVMAAVAAARNGVKVILIERFACLGGVATMGLPLQGYCRDNGQQIVTGLAEEFRQRLIARGGAVDHFIHCQMHNPFVVIAPESVKIVCQQMLQEAGVTILLNTMVVDVVGTPEKPEAVIIEGKSGRAAVTGRVFLDTTGDADLVARLGLPCFMASNQDLQASTLGIILSNVDKTKLQKRLLEDPETYDLYPLIPREQIGNADYYIMAGLGNLVKKAMQEKQFEWLYGMTNFVTMPDELIYINSVHVSGQNTCDTVDLSQLEQRAREQADMVVNFMRKYIPGFEDAVVVSTGPWLGIRESRIIDGVTTLTLDDIQHGRIPQDTIALGGYPYDFHQKDNADNKVQFYKVPAYGIPYGCMIPKHTRNLYVAGKTISATREAMCSSRVMAQCMAEGQAAGTAAALCVTNNCSSMELDIQQLRDVLRRDGAKLD